MRKLQLALLAPPGNGQPDAGHSGRNAPAPDPQPPTPSATHCPYK